ncbi:MAG: DUF4430 domain-containing protein [Patescibacteria group bacterium]
MKKHSAFLVIFFLLAGFSLSACQNLQLADLSQLSSDKQQPLENTTSVSNSLVVEITGSASTQGATVSAKQQATYTMTATKDGQTAYELLSSSTKVESKKYDFGVFIESINGLKGDDKNFWAFKVNGEMAQQAVDKTVLKTGDVVSFEYTPIEAADIK